MRLQLGEPPSKASRPDAEADSLVAVPSATQEEQKRKRAEAQADAVSVTAYFDDGERSERALELYLEAQFEADEQLAAALRSHLDPKNVTKEQLDAILDQVVSSSIILFSVRPLKTSIITKFSFVLVII